jgi:hypothetical protein
MRPLQDGQSTPRRRGLLPMSMRRRQAGTNTPEEKADFIADVNALLKLVSAAAGHKLCRELHLTDI